MTKMAEAQDVQQIAPELYIWSAYEPSVKCDLYSTALVFNGNLIVIDPIPLAAEPWKKLTAMAPLRAVFLTNGNHERNAQALRKAYQVPVVSSVATSKVLEKKSDVIPLPNELLYGISAIALPGAGEGEIAYLSPQGILCLGDAVLNVSPEKGLELLPDKYCLNPTQNRQSLRSLLDLDFKIITFAHGLPVVTQAREKLRALLA